MTENQKGILAAGLLFIGVISFFGMKDTPASIPARGNTDVPGAGALLEEMPESSNHTYGTSEYQILNDIASKGMVIRQYKRTFMNLGHRDYDISAAYRDFDKDMEQFASYLKQDILRLRSLRPAQADAMASQHDAIVRAERLYQVIARYNQHEFDTRDTLAYLDDCAYALDRLSLQSKLPQ